MARTASHRRNVFSTLQWQRAVSQLGRAMASKLSLDAVFREFVAGIKGYIPYDLVWICSVDAQNQIKPLFFLPSSAEDMFHSPAELYERGESVTGWAVQERKPFVREDTSAQQRFETDRRLSPMGFHSYISVPLIYWDRVVGVFHLASRRSKAYGKRELAFLISVAEWLAIAMENARFFQETHRLLEEQGVLHEVVSQINTLDLDSLLQRLTREVLNIFRVDCVFVRLRQPDGTLRLCALSGIELTAYQKAGGVILEGRGRSSWILDNRRPLVIRDLREQDPSISKGKGLDEMGFRSYLGVPILLREEGVGTLVVLSRTVRDFSGRDIFFLQQLAAEAAIAIHHALLFHELKRLNRNLEEATEHKSRFLAHLAHELRTPLSVIVGILGIMESGATGPMTDEQRTALNKIQDQSYALQKMANDLLNLSRIESGNILVEITTFPMDGLVESLKTLTEDLQRKNGLKVVWDIDADLPRLTTDAGKLEAILQNLIVNAFKYTAEGEVRIRIKNRPETKSIELAVEDTGQGISPEHLPKIFEGFHQVQPTAAGQGVGLGLAIVKKYLELLKGSIRVASELGRGSTFTATLPCDLRLRA